LDSLFPYQSIQQLAALIQKIHELVKLVTTHVHTATLGNPLDASLWRHQNEDRNVSEPLAGEQARLDARRGV
jgi:hypothetical protein